MEIVMKRIIIFILTAVLLLSLSSCFLLPTVESMDWAILTVTEEDARKGDLVIVKAGDSALPPADADLGTVADVWKAHAPSKYQISNPDARLDKDALEALDDMLTAFYHAKKTDNVLVTAAYLTPEELESRPADHLTGLTCELKYITSDENGAIVTHDLSEDPTCAWFAENCYRYGFVVRYPADKAAVTGVTGFADCFRYVGPLHAEYMFEHGLCLEEYIEELKGYDRMKRLSVYTNGEHYELFYADISVSKEVLYPAYTSITYSGTGDSGMIIIVRD